MHAGQTKSANGQLVGSWKRGHNKRPTKKKKKRKEKDVTVGLWDWWGGGGGAISAGFSEVRSSRDLTGPDMVDCGALTGSRRATPGLSGLGMVGWRGDLWLVAWLSEARDMGQDRSNFTIFFTRKASLSLVSTLPLSSPLPSLLQQLFSSPPPSPLVTPTKSTERFITVTTANMFMASRIQRRAFSASARNVSTVDGRMHRRNRQTPTGTTAITTTTIPAQPSQRACTCAPSAALPPRRRPATTSPMPLPCTR